MPFPPFDDSCDRYILLMQGRGRGALQGAALTGISGAAARLHALPHAAAGRGLVSQGLQELLRSCVWRRATCYMNLQDALHL